MRKQILIMCLLLLSVCGYAQQITVKGVVTAEVAFDWGNSAVERYYNGSNYRF